MWRNYRIGGGMIEFGIDRVRGTCRPSLIPKEKPPIVGTDGVKITKICDHAVWNMEGDGHGKTWWACIYCGKTSWIHPSALKGMM